MNTKALIVVDMQNDFCPGGVLAVPSGDTIIPTINKLLSQFELIIFTKDWHPADAECFVSQHPGKKPFEQYWEKVLILFFLLLAGLHSNAQVINVTDQQLFKAFKQDIVKFQGTLSKFGGGGNCASIALIKSAIGNFGINGVFKNITIDSVNKMVHVTLRDDATVDLTFNKYNNGKKYFSIQKIGDDNISKQIADYARICFAVMCRREQLKLGYDKNRFYRGVDKLNKGQAAEDIYTLLGLKNEIITDLSFDNLKNFKNLVVYNRPHAVYSSSGNYDEFFRGTVTGIEPLNRLNFFHCKTEDGCPILGAYTLK